MNSYLAHLDWSTGYIWEVLFFKLTRNKFIKNSWASTANVVVVIVSLVRLIFLGRDIFWSKYIYMITTGLAFLGPREPLVEPSISFHPPFHQMQQYFFLRITENVKHFLPFPSPSLFSSTYQIFSFSKYFPPFPSVFFFSSSDQILAVIFVLYGIGIKWRQFSKV